MTYDDFIEKYKHLKLSAEIVFANEQKDDYLKIKLHANKMTVLDISFFIIDAMSLNMKYKLKIIMTK